jgi:hypothetical protein
MRTGQPEPPTYCYGVPSFGQTPHGHVAGTLPEKGPRDSIVQPAPSGAEDSSASMEPLDGSTLHGGHVI